MLLATLCALAQDPGHDAAVHGGPHHRFDDAARWAQVFDDPARDAWQKPDALVAALGLAPGADVADIGAGTGYLNARLAHAVGAEGTVIPVDIEPEMVAYMTERAGREATPNVRPRLGTANSPGLRRNEVDLVLLVDTYHHIEDRTAYFADLRRAVRRGGRLVVVDFRTDVDTSVGPPAAMRLAPDAVTAELTAAGWTPAGTLSVELPYQYALVYTR